MHDAMPSPQERLSGAMQHIYPKRALSALMFQACRVRFKPWKNWQIQWFIRKYGVNMEDALECDPLAYGEFNTFFTRPLHAQARPIADAANAVVSPADGRILEFGRVTAGRLLQVKGQEMDVTRLLGGPSQWSEPFRNGRFVTVYLSPRDYHRVHMPVDGTLRAMAHIPGALFSVSVTCVRTIPGLFTRNERVVSFFDTPVGPMALILVGAVFVGSIETLWAGAVPGRRKAVTWYEYQSQQPQTIARGHEMGRFNMGSTAIAVFADDAVQWANDLTPGMSVKMGQTLGSSTLDNSRSD
jgi:phosphatidylserine decarboxylase